MYSINRYLLNVPAAAATVGCSAVRLVHLVLFLFVRRVGVTNTGLTS